MENALTVGSVRIDLARAVAWEPSFERSAPLRFPALRDDLASAREERPTTRSLLQALLESDKDAIQANAYALLGLGPGLTPAGDDFLCGLLVGLRVLGSRAPQHTNWAASLCTLLSEMVEREAPRRTNALSRTLLVQAGRGVAVEPLLDVLCTLGSGAPLRGIETLLAIGHSSGGDMLAGACFAAHAVLEREERYGAALAGPA
jgi:hypothetical protein